MTYNILLLFLLPILRAISLKETADQLEKKLSEYQSKEVFTTEMQMFELSITISDVKSILTYKEREFKSNSIFYDSLIYFYFNITIEPIELVEPIASIKRQLVMKLNLDNLSIIENKNGIYSVILPFCTQDAHYDISIDIFEYNLFDEIYYELPIAITPFLYRTFELSLKHVIKDNFPSSHEALFRNFIGIVSDNYFIVINIMPFREWPERIRFRSIQYTFKGMESEHRSLFTNIILIADFYMNYTDHSSEVRISALSFSMFGITFDTISVPEINSFLIEVIPQIFNRVFDNINFRDMWLE